MFIQSMVYMLSHKNTNVYPWITVEYSSALYKQSQGNYVMCCASFLEGVCILITAIKKHMYIIKTMTHVGYFTSNN